MDRRGPSIWRQVAWVAAGWLLFLMLLAVGLAWWDDETDAPTRIMSYYPVLKAPLKLALDTGEGLQACGMTVQDWTARVIPNPLFKPQRKPAKFRRAARVKKPKEKDKLFAGFPILEESAEAVGAAVGAVADTGQNVYGVVEDEFFPTEAALEVKQSAGEDMQHLYGAISNKQKEIENLQGQIQQMQNQIATLEKKAHPHKRLLPLLPLGFLKFGGGSPAVAGGAAAPGISLPGIPNLPGLPGGGNGGGDDGLAGSGFGGGSGSGGSGGGSGSGGSGDTSTGGSGGSGNPGSSGTDGNSSAATGGSGGQSGAGSANGCACP